METPSLPNGDHEDLKEAAVSVLVPKACKKQNKSKSKYIKTVYVETRFLEYVAFNGNMKKKQLHV